MNISLTHTVREQAARSRVSESQYLSQVAESAQQLEPEEKVSLSKLASIVRTDGAEAAELKGRLGDAGLGLVVASALAHASALSLMMQDVSRHLGDPALPSPQDPGLALEPSIRVGAENYSVEPSEYAEALVESASEGWGQEGLDDEHVESARALFDVLQDGIRAADRPYLEGLDVADGNCDAVAAGQILTDALGLDRSLRPALERVSQELQP
ncbi:MAG: hypothetical protein HY323_00280 [Betaproteobacteria bacterium]|nr:hypothetical protein [Betaproteobacteria bacterium]